MNPLVLLLAFFTDKTPQRASPADGDDPDEAPDAVPLVIPDIAPDNAPDDAPDTPPTPAIADPGTEATSRGSDTTSAASAPEAGPSLSAMAWVRTAAGQWVPGPSFDLPLRPPSADAASQRQYAREMASLLTFMERVASHDFDGTSSSSEDDELNRVG